MIKRWQAKLLSWSIHCALLSCPDRDLDLPVNKSRSNLYLRLYSHVYWIFILIKSYISGCFPHMPECPLEKKTQIKFKRIHIICSRKTFLSKNFEIYTIFSSFDDSNISVWCPSFANVFSPCQEKLYFFIRFSFQLSPNDERGADRSCEDRLWQSSTGIKTKAS